MKNLLILAVFVTALFGCSTTGEVTPINQDGEYVLESFDFYNSKGLCCNESLLAVVAKPNF